VPAADLTQIRALAAAHLPQSADGQVLALRADPVWTGPTVDLGGGRPLRVVACPAPLAVRAALVAERPAGELLVILTPCTGSELGLDVRARLVKRDVLALDPFTTLQALFAAGAIEPALVAERWLIDDLIAHAPAGGWRDRSPANGVVDVELAWRTWHHAVLGADLEPAHLTAVLTLGEYPRIGQTLTAMDPERRDRLGRRWQETLASVAAPVLVDLLAAGAGPDLAALGLVAGVLWAPTDRADLAELQRLARARLEDRFGRDRLTAGAAAAWSDAVGRLWPATTRQAEILDRAEAELARADAGALAVFSDLLPTGFDGRLTALAAALAARDAEQAASLLDWAARHARAERRGHRIAAAGAAVRLLRRQDGPPPRSTSSGLAAAAARYASEGAYVDEAVRLLDDGDALPPLGAAYAALVASVAAGRDRADAAFADELVTWSASEPVDDERIVPLEHLLARVVAPIAASAPVLVVVGDGVGLPVAHQLLRDLRLEHWAPAGPEGAGPWPTGVALLPTVTDVSRTSLLTGTRTVGGQADERAGFAEHPDLRAASCADKPPVLFHKAGLVAPSGLALPDAIRARIADPDQRVVGVVVNAVDDHLARGDQVRVGWDLESLRPLGWLLDAALDAGRVVVLTADHGHVLHARDAALRSGGGGGERWRPAPPPAGAGEVTVSGPRVLRGDGTVILPADHRIRYAGHKHGYHGGATPAEVLVPVAVLARRLPEGWRYRPDTEPAWWSAQPTPPTPEPTTAPTRPAPASDAQTRLFDPAPQPPPPVAAEGWVDRLLASPAFTEQRRRVRLPRPLPDDRLRAYLGPVAANCGTLALAALAAVTGEPPDTLRLALSPLQRLLNVDGTEVLAVRADGTIVLDLDLAALAFELPDR